MGYIFLALIVVMIVVVGLLAFLGSRLDKESKAFVDAAIPAIVSDWDVDEVRKRASPEFEDMIDYDDVQEYFDSLKELGELSEYKGSTGDSNITISLQYGFEITADYVANADFETGSAGIEISLIKHGKQWQILDLRITPQPFTERKDII